MPTTPFFRDVKAKLLTLVAAPLPAGFYMGLHSGAPGADGSANQAAGVARQVASLAFVSAGLVQLASAVEFPSMPDVNITHLSLWDALTAGNCWLWVATSTVGGLDDVDAGETYRVPAGLFAYQEVL